MAKTGFWLQGVKEKLAGAIIYKGADNHAVSWLKICNQNN